MVLGYYSLGVAAFEVSGTQGVGRIYGTPLLVLLWYLGSWVWGRRVQSGAYPQGPHACIVYNCELQAFLRGNFKPLPTPYNPTPLSPNLKGDMDGCSGPVALNPKPSENKAPLFSFMLSLKSGLGPAGSECSARDDQKVPPHFPCGTSKRSGAQGSRSSVECEEGPEKKEIDA